MIFPVAGTPEVSGSSLRSIRGAMKLTKPSIERLALPPGKSEAIFFDDDVPGFGLRVRAGGSRTFIVQYALGGRQRPLTIGAAQILDATKAHPTPPQLLPT